MDRLKVLGRWRRDDFPSGISEDEQRALDHIAEVSKNARTTWFGLIGLLLFCGVTLLGVEDKDFFEYGASTQLPLVNVSVPTKNFFWAAPILVTGLYIYLHLYLDKLWWSLAALPPKIGGQDLDTVVYPWMIADAAIQLRPASPARLYRWLTLGAIGGLAWLSGPAVMLIFWIWSWAPHDEWLTSFIGLQLALTAGMAVFSARRMLILMRQVQSGDGVPPIWAGRFLRTVMASILTYGVLSYGWAKTEDGHFWAPPGTEDAEVIYLYPANLFEARIAQRSDDWKSRDIAQEHFLREQESFAGINRGSLEVEFDRLREDYIANIPSTDLSKSDLRGADLRHAFLAGTMLPETSDLRGAKLRGVVLEGSSYWDPLYDVANLSFARLERANLVGAHLEHAALFNARLDRANLTYARLNGANLSSARLVEADFSGAQLNLAQLRAALLDGARLEGVDMTHVDAFYASVFGTQLDQTKNLTQEQLDAMFGDASTEIPETLDRPVHWPDRTVLKQERYALWSAWALERGADELWFPEREQE